MNETDLNSAEETLRKQLEEIQQKKAELAATKAITVAFLSFDDLRFYFKFSDLRADLSDLVNSYPSHMVHQNVRQRSMLLKDYPAFSAALRKMRGIFSKYASQDIKNGIESFEFRPLYRIDLIKFGISNYFTVKAEKDSSLRFKMFNIPEIVYDATHDRFRVPLVYGYKVAELFAGVERTEWKDEAYSTALAQLETREKVFHIGLQGKIEGYQTSLQGVELRGFQEVMVSFAEANGGRTLARASVGLGKTLIALDYAQRNNYRTLIVCRGFLKINWERAVQKLTGHVPYVLTGSRPTTVDMRELLVNKPRYTIINYDILRSHGEVIKEWVDESGIRHKDVQDRYLWVDLLKLCGFDCMIGDEIQAIRNSESSQSIAVRELKDIPKIIVTTANPMFNNLGDLWPILNLLQPLTFTNKSGFLADYTTDGKSPKDMEKLHEILQPIMIQRLKKDVLPELPAIVENYEYVELSPKAQKIYNKIMQGIYAELDKHGNIEDKGLINNILAKINRAKMVCSIDKQQAVADFALDLYDNSEDEKKKVIIGSQFKVSVYGIGRLLGHEALSASGDDDKKVRQGKVDQFQQDKEIKFLSAQMHSIGEGLDITEAGNVIIADPWWNHAVHSQFIGRCYGRLNDLHGANVFYFICKGTLEEWIYELIGDKAGMESKVFDGAEEGRTTSVIKELIKRLKKERKR